LRAVAGLFETTEEAVKASTPAKAKANNAATTALILNIVVVSIAGSRTMSPGGRILRRGDSDAECVSFSLFGIFHLPNKSL